MTTTAEMENGENKTADVSVNQSAEKIFVVDSKRYNERDLDRMMFSPIDHTTEVTLAGSELRKLIHIVREQGIYIGQYGAIITKGMEQSPKPQGVSNVVQ